MVCWRLSAAIQALYYKVGESFVRWFYFGGDMKKLLFTLSALTMLAIGGDIEDAQKAIYAKEYDKALTILKKAMREGNPRASFLLGKLYLSGIGIDKEKEKDLLLSQQSSNPGDIDTRSLLGLLYFERKNYQKALYYFKGSAEQGNIISQVYLGEIYQKGAGVQQDYKKAIELYEKAIAQGSSYPDASILSLIHI